MAQVTVRIPDETKRALDEAAKRLERRPSEIIRLALNRFLELDERARTGARDRVRSLLGSLQSGVPDLAERHREYVLERLRNDG